MKRQKRQRSEIRSHGLRLLMPNHRSVRQLKREHAPSNHGDRVWPTSWLMVDCLKKSGMGEGSRVLDLGCGWGLAGVFCAKAFDARVTWIDGDGEVYPYVNLLAEKNGVTGEFMKMDIDHVGRDVLKDIDIVVSSDICFCDTLIDPLRRFIGRAKSADVSRVYISDPGRWPFDDLAEMFVGKKGTQLLEWKVTKPVTAQGKILKMSF